MEFEKQRAHILFNSINDIIEKDKLETVNRTLFEFFLMLCMQNFMDAGFSRDDIERKISSKYWKLTSLQVSQAYDAAFFLREMAIKSLKKNLKHYTPKQGDRVKIPASVNGTGKGSRGVIFLLPDGPTAEVVEEITGNLFTIAKNQIEPIYI